MSKLKNYCSIYTGNSISDSNKDKYTFVEGSVPYISTKDINLKTNEIDYSNGMFVKEDIDKFKLAPKNSTLLCIEGGSAGKKIGYLKEDVCFVNKLCCFSDFKGNPRFLYYYLQSDNFLSVFNLNITGLIGGVSQSVIKNIFVNFPNQEKQTKIANYLDNKCSKIDKTIEDNNKAIRLLEEYKQNYIGDVFNEISKEHKSVKLKYIGNLQNGISAAKEKFESGNGTFINYGDVYNNNTIPDSPKGIIDLTESESNIYSLKRGDILFTRTSETIEEVGMSAVCVRDYPDSAFSGFVIRFRPYKDNMLPEFYKYYFNLLCHRDYFAREMNLVTRASLSQGLLGNMKVVLTNMDKQKQIANKLDSFCSSIDKIIEYRKKIIEKLEEYKKSLIYEVVTGKKEV